MAWTRRPRISSCVCAITLLGAPAAAAAPGVSVTTGALVMNGTTGTLLVGGTRGFTLESSVSVADGVFGPRVCTDVPRACIPGATLDLTALWAGGDVRGTGSLEGIEYGSLGAAASPNGANIQFTGGVRLPLMNGQAVTARAPFTFTGTFDSLDSSGVPRRDSLSGSGIALLTLVPNSAEPASWTIPRIAYAFDQSIPAPWVSADIGSPGVEGDALMTGTQLALAGAGADIWGASDAFRFMFQRAHGDVDLRTRVTYQEDTDAYAKAGLMMRSGVGRDAATVILDRKPNGALEFMMRESPGGQMRYLAGASQDGWPWLRLRRTGDLVTAFHSADGQHWVGIGSALLPGVRFVGLVTSSHDAGELGRATFAGIQAESLATSTANAWSSADVGAVGATGKTAIAAERVTLTGAGTDIWGSADGFRFLYRPLGNDVSLVARVLGLEGRHPFAKAGLMVRSSNSAEAPHIVVDMKPSGEIELMTRRTAGGETAYIAGAYSAFPSWLKLERQAGAVVASMSADDVTWTELGRIDWPTGVDLLAGIVVTSHQFGTLAEAVVDNLTLSAGK